MRNRLEFTIMANKRIWNIERKKINKIIAHKFNDVPLLNRNRKKGTVCNVVEKSTLMPYRYLWLNEIVDTSLCTYHMDYQRLSRNQEPRMRMCNENVAENEKWDYLLK